MPGYRPFHQPTIVVHLDESAATPGAPADGRADGNDPVASDVIDLYCRWLGAHSRQVVVLVPKAPESGRRNGSAIPAARNRVSYTNQGLQSALPSVPTRHVWIMNGRHMPMADRTVVRNELRRLRAEVVVFGLARESGALQYPESLVVNEQGEVVRFQRHYHDSPRYNEVHLAPPAMIVASAHCAQEVAEHLAVRGWDLASMGALAQRLRVRWSTAADALSAFVRTTRERDEADVAPSAEGTSALSIRFVHDTAADIRIVQRADEAGAPVHRVATDGSNGHGPNGHGSNGHGSNGHGSNGHGSNGHGSRPHGQDGHNGNGNGSHGHARDGNGDACRGNGSSSRSGSRLIPAMTSRASGSSAGSGNGLRWNPAAGLGIMVQQSARGSRAPTVPVGPWTYRFAKRAADIIVSVLGLIALAPLFAGVAMLIKCTSRGPVLFRHRRQGRRGREFPCLKFRSMKVGADAMQGDLRAKNEVDGPQFKLSHDPRLTRLGLFLRNTNLDELPQLINVLMGHMSLVGPRPSPDDENQLCPAWRRTRLSVRPGITGLWQVLRLRDQSHSDFQEWIYYDTEYVRHQSLWLDLQLILYTPMSMFASRRLIGLARRLARRGICEHSARLEPDRRGTVDPGLSLNACT